MSVGEGTSWSSERGSLSGYGGSSGNAGNGRSGRSGNGLSNTSGTPVSKSVGDVQARLAGINTTYIVGYFLDTTGRIIGIDTRISGDAYGVAIGYLPPEPNGKDVSNNKDSPGGNVPYNVDISSARITHLKKVIADNAALAASKQDGRRIRKARRDTLAAQSELALIDATVKVKPP